ncbi:MAG: hypothetical protein ABSG00_03095 [Terracidiphilus sp.]
MCGKGNQTTTYSYDTASNVAEVTYPNNLTSKFTYGALNRLTALSTTTSPVSSYNYTLGATGGQYTYDSKNHLIKMVNGPTVVTLQYDAFGNRVAKTVNGVTTKYKVFLCVALQSFLETHIQEFTGDFPPGIDLIDQAEEKFQELCWKLAGKVRFLP